MWHEINFWHARRYSKKLKKYNRALGEKGNPNLSPKSPTKYQLKLRAMKEAMNRRGGL